MCKSGRALHPIKKSKMEGKKKFRLQRTNREKIAKRVAKLVGLSWKWSGQVQIRSGRALSHQKVWGCNLFDGGPATSSAQQPPPSPANLRRSLHLMHHLLRADMIIDIRVATPPPSLQPAPPPLWHPPPSSSAADAKP